jgi:putative ABC transport system permease protein
VDRTHLLRNAAIGAGALRTHRLRTALTTLGVVFGVAAVICMLAIGKGAEQRVLAEYRRLGVRNLHVESRPAATAAAAPGGAAAAAIGLGLVADDARALAAELAPHVAAVAAERSLDRRVVSARGHQLARVCGVSPQYADLLGIELLGGRFIAPLDEASAAAVCVLSEPLAAALFPAQSPLGEVVRVGEQALRVVGLVRAQPLATGGAPPLYAPLETAWRMLPRGHDPRGVERIVLRLAVDADPQALAAVVTAALRRRHGAALDFAVVVPSELVRKEQRTQRIFQTVMGGIAGISLLVGGIGIANILFASVVERTGEIGVRRAVGARRGDIVAQFLFEAATMGVAGGVAGIALGIAGAVGVARAADWPILVTPASVVLATGTALATGLVSGAVPARAASRVQAIEALRHV